jgi:acyl transferase domain-containing protein
MISLDTAIKMLADDERQWATAMQPVGLGSSNCRAWSVASACDLEQAWAANRTPDQLRELPSDFITTLQSSVTSLTALVQLGTVAVPWATNLGRPDGVELPLISAVVDQQSRCQRLMEALARVYVLGANIDWTTVHTGKTHRVLLPTYPFQKKAFWMEPVALGMDHLPIVPRTASKAVHRVHVADDPRAFIYECQVPCLEAADVERNCHQLVAEAWRSSNGEHPVATKDWVFHIPEPCSVDGPWLLQLVMRPVGDGAFVATVYCRAEAGSPPLVWHKLATAELTPAT